jgi:ubiquinone/menaquinone biosynthesis C-methylase UbiE
MAEVNLLDLYPKAKRNLEERAKVKEEDRILAWQFGKEYFDGTRNQGYGGYKYDGRWKPIVKRFKEYYELAENASILDVGCAKGFMLHDFHELMPLATLAGIDISEYGVENAMEDVKPFLRVGNAKSLPFPDHSFDLVVSINTIHNLERDECFEAVKEIERVGKKAKFITVDAYRDEEQKKRMYQWNLTAKTIMSVDEWMAFFEEAGYTGDYHWFIP